MTPTRAGLGPAAIGECSPLPQPRKGPGIDSTAMFLFRTKAEMVDPQDALAGRDERMPVPERHDVLGTPLEPPFPEGFERAVFGMGCFWGAEREFWQARRRLHDRRRLRRRLHAEPDLRRGLHRPDRPHRGRARRFDPRKHELRGAAAASSGRTTTPRRACGRATTSARSTARRSTSSPSSAPPPRPRATSTSGCSPTAGYGAITTEIADAGPVLLRRGVPPAVPREEPERLLRPRRHGRRLPGRARERELARYRTSLPDARCTSQRPPCVRMFWHRTTRGGSCA